jgi:hypothetical protein
MEEKETTEREKKEIVKNKQQQRQQKERTDFTVSYHRYRNNQPLKANDYRNLLRKVRHGDDSPLRSKVTHLQQQWQNRKQRLEQYEITPEYTNPIVRNEVPEIVRTMEL